MIAVHVLIPLSDNDGLRFSQQHHAEFERFCTEVCGGLTRLSGEVSGMWLASGVTYRDTHIVYVIALQSITHGQQVGEVVEFAKRHYRQQAVFVAYLGQVEIL